MLKSFFNKAIRVLLATNALILLASAMLGPIYAIFVEKIGGDLMDASIAGGLFAIAAGITTFLSGKYSDKTKENELVLVAGYLTIGFGFLLYIIANSIIFLFIAQIIIGFGDAIYSPAFDSIFTKHLNSHKSGKQWGAWEALNYFTTAIGAIIGGLVATKFGFTPLFIIMASLCFASAIYIYFLPRKIL
jgi:MFS family permease